MEHDASTGLYRTPARYYNPGLGRFLSEDPIGFAGGDTNLFAYAGNDPLNSTDPSGLQAVPQASLGLSVPAPLVQRRRMRPKRTAPDVYRIVIFARSSWTA
jgi:RHS repeat-associated protein